MTKYLMVTTGGCVVGDDEEIFDVIIQGSVNSKDFGVKSINAISLKTGELTVCEVVMYNSYIPRIVLKKAIRF